jgi:ribosomal protein L22
MADEKDKQAKGDDKPKARSRSTAAKPKPKSAAAKAEPKAAAKSGARARPKKDDAASKRGARKPTAKAEASKADADAPKAEKAEKAEAPKAKAPARRRAAAEKPKEAARPRRRQKPEPVSRPVVHARAKYVRSSARKARLVMDHVRGKSVSDARAVLRHSPRGVARDLERLLKSAVANAENNHDLVGDDLYVKEIYADEGPTLRRFRPRAQGRATRIRKRTSHLTVTLSPKE